MFNNPHLRTFVFRRKGFLHPGRQSPSFPAPLRNNVMNIERSNHSLNMAHKTCPTVIYIVYISIVRCPMQGFQRSGWSSIIKLLG